ncbi:hypothetical protein [Zavarzinella formosa]|uniref:hypothetical protein n=1 Tax=Zavarzinella formosa TaxID=360055 RepID=UPI0002E4FFED|nr:hypothetical protein [Zavarzinella formosa]
MFAEYYKMAEAMPRPFNAVGFFALGFVEVAIKACIEIGFFGLAVYMAVYLARRTIIPMFIK